MNMEFPLLTPLTSCGDITKHHWQSQYLTLTYPAEQKKCQEKDNNKGRRHTTINTLTDIKGKLKEDLFRRHYPSLNSYKHSHLFSKTTSSTKRKLRLHSKSVRFWSRRVHISTNADNQQCVDLGMFSQVATVDLSQDEVTFSHQLSEPKAITEKGQDTCLELRQNFKSIMSKFAGNTTAHGYKNITTKNRGKIHRLAWIMAIVCVTLTLFFFTKDVFLSYQAHSFTSSVKHRPSQSLAFPTVTLCSTNPWDTNKLSLPSQYNADLETEELDYKSGVAPKNFNHFEARFGINLKEFLVDCHWNGRPYPCSELFSRTVSDTAGCFSFNWNASTRLHVSSVGTLSGLNVTLRTGHSLLDGVKVVIHEPDEFPNMVHHGILVSTGNLAHIGLKREEYHFLPTPYLAYGTENCEDISEDEERLRLHHYPLYRGYSGCLAECRLNYIIKQCHCRGFNFPCVKGVPHCRANQLDCYYEALEMAYNLTLARNIDNCSCPLPCRKTEYSWRMSSSQYNVKNSVVVKVFYENLFTRVEEQLPQREWKELFASVGGYFGLFTGASVLTIMEFLDLCMLLIYASWPSLSQVIKAKIVSAR